MQRTVAMKGQVTLVSIIVSIVIILRRDYHGHTYEGRTESHEQQFFVK